MSSDATRARCRQMPVVRCHRVPDAARCQLPDAPPPGPGGGLGEVSRAPVLMSFVLISGSCCRRQFWSPTACDDERRAPAVKSGVSLLSLPPVQRFCSALSFHQRVLQTLTTCGPSVADLEGCVVLTFHRLRSLGHRPQRRRRANRRFRPWRPAAAADSLFPAPSAHGGGRRTRRFRRAACWLWLPSCRSFKVL